MDRPYKNIPGLIFYPINVQKVFPLGRDALALNCRGDGKPSPASGGDKPLPYIFLERIIMDFSEMNRDELFLYVEGILKQKGFHSVTELWGETALRVEKDDPELAAMLRLADIRWKELN